MNEKEFKDYVVGTQSLVAKMNESLAQIEGAIHKVAEIEKQQLMLAASAYDMSFLAVRTLAELHVDFRTMLLRFAAEPATNPAAQGNRDLLRNLLAAMQKSSGERPTLKPVPPPGRGA